MVMKVKDVAERAASYGMRSMIADGMNVFDVHEKASAAINAARAGEGPTLLELKTFRYSGHSRRDPNNYMSKEEKEIWKNRDAILSCEKTLTEAGMLNPEKISSIRQAVLQKVENAMKFAQESPFPSPQDVEDGLYVTMGVPQ
jgi:pyruvate dehydrogenase E1 component alpha subunit